MYGELVEQLLDLVIEVGVEEVQTPADAVLKGGTRGGDEQLVQRAHGLVMHLGSGAEHLEVVRVVTELGERLNGLREEAFERIAGPLDGVLDLVGIVL